MMGLVRPGAIQVTNCNVELGLQGCAAPYSVV